MLQILVFVIAVSYREIWDILHYTMYSLSVYGKLYLLNTALNSEYLSSYAIQSLFHIKLLLCDLFITLHLFLSIYIIIEFRYRVYLHFHIIKPNKIFIAL